MKQLKTLQKEAEAIMEEAYRKVGNSVITHVSKAFMEFSRKITEINARSTLCQHMDCDRNSIGKFREGFVFVWLCTIHCHGKMCYSEVCSKTKNTRNPGKRCPSGGGRN